MTMPLSDTEIRKSKAGPKPYKLSDGCGLYSPDLNPIEKAWSKLK